MSEPVRNARGRVLRASAFAATAALLIGIAIQLWPRERVIPEPIAKPVVARPLDAPSVRVAEAIPMRPAWSQAMPSASVEPPAPSSEPAPMDRHSFNARRAAVTQRELDDVNTWIKYPLWSQPLTENMMAKPSVPYHSELPGPNGAFPVLEFFTDKANYKLGEPITVFAIAHGANGVIGFDALTGHTMSGNPTDKPRPSIDLQWTDMPDHSGQMATLVIPEAVERANRGEWGINIDCQIQAEHRVGHNLFYVMATDATITGPYRAANENGSLSVYVGITLTAAGREHLKGELWGPHGEPIAYAWVLDENVPLGPSTMKLVFYGKTIRDSDADGPYTVKNLILTSFEPDNSRLSNDPVDPSLTTLPFKRTDFTDVPINGDNGNLNEKKRVYQQELTTAQHDGYDPTNPAPPPKMHIDPDAPAPQ